MKWWKLALLAAGLIWTAATQIKKIRSAGSADTEAQAQKPETAGEQIETALASGDFDAQLAAVPLETDAVKRHLSLTAIVEKAYKKRQDPAMREILVTHARLYLVEFDDMMAGIKAEYGGELPVIIPIKLLAMNYEDQQDYGAAAMICKKALRLNLDDGTKTGYAGRLKRLEKKMAVSAD